MVNLFQMNATFSLENTIYHYVNKFKGFFIILAKYVNNILYLFP